jgi:tRNA dimethylallyltransferase
VVAGRVTGSGEAPALLVVGPTAVGKSALGLAVAEALGGEIVSLDSRQMVRRLDIGTAKPSPEERARVHHHLVDVVDPDEPLPLPEVLARIDAALADIRSRGRWAVLVGGTGQYVRAMREGWRVPAVPPDAALRAELAAYAERQGPAALHARLEEADPAAAARIDARNVRRVIRGIEVARARQAGPAERLPPAGPPNELRVVGLDRPRAELYERVDARIDRMIELGLEDEVRGLVADGYDWRLPALSSVGYAEWRPYFEGTVDRGEVVRRIRHDTRRLVRSQDAWFRRADPGIRWLVPAGDALAPAQLAELLGWLRPPGAVASDGAAGGGL